MSSKPKTITLNKSKPERSLPPKSISRSQTPARVETQPLTAQQRASKFAPLSVREPRERQVHREPVYEEDVEEEEEPVEEEEEEEWRSASPARQSEEELEYEEEPPRSASPPRRKRPQTPPRKTSNGNKPEPAGLGREFSSLLLQNIPKHMIATDLFLSVFDASDDAAEIEMHTHKDGSSTGTAQMYFEREGAAEAAARKYNGKVVEGKPLRMLVIKAVSKQTTPPKRKRDPSSSPPRKSQGGSKPESKERVKIVRAESAVAPKAVVAQAKPTVQTKRALVKPTVERKPTKETPTILLKQKPSSRTSSEQNWTVVDGPSGFAEYEEERPHKTAVVRPKIKQDLSERHVVRDGRPQVVLAKKDRVVSTR